MHLQRTFSGFPSGWAGAALLALRMMVGASAGFEALSVIAGTQPGANAAMTIGAVGAAIAGLAVMVGFMTPFACAFLCVEGVIAMLAHPAVGGLRLFDSTMVSLQFVVMSAALIALGPGAVSVDARRFGRREVAIRERQRPGSP